VAEKAEVFVENCNMQTLWTSDNADSLHYTLETSMFNGDCRCNDFIEYRLIALVNGQFEDYDRIGWQFDDFDGNYEAKFGSGQD